MRGKIDRFVTWMRRHRNLIALSAGGVILIRLWPLLAVETGWNLRGAIVHQHPESSFLPPPVAPVEIRSGRAHPGFHAPRLAAELIFLPTAVRHGHAFKRDDPALPPASALALAILLSDPPLTRSGWEKAVVGAFMAIGTSAGPTGMKRSSAKDATRSCSITRIASSDVFQLGGLQTEEDRGDRPASVSRVIQSRGKSRLG